jgi:hypothetical protein
VRGRVALDEPFGWWGPVWASPEPRPIGHLIENGVLTAEAAALLWTLLERRASIVVAAGPSGAGKTTLLTALLDFLPTGTRRIYLRGCYEPFDFLGDTDPATAALLVNELSPHLPIYLWGPGVRRALGAAREGYQLAATAHATSVDEFVYALAGYPLRVPIEEIAAIDLLVLLDAWLDGRGARREVGGIVHLAPGSTPGSLAPAALAWRAHRGAPLGIDVAASTALFARLGGDPARLAEAVAQRASALSRAIGSEHS